MATHVQAQSGMFPGAPQSPGGGRRITVTTAVAAVVAANSGDLVVIETTESGYLVGIAIGDYDANTGTIVLDTEGVWNLLVTGAEETPSNAAVEVGNILFSDEAAGEINMDLTLGLRIGTAWGTVVSGETTRIPVKLDGHPHV